MANPKYVARIARLPEVFELLGGFPEGLPIAELASRLVIPPAELREDLLAFYTADVGPDWLMGLSRPEALEFLGRDGESEDPNDAEVVRILDPRPTDELGVEYVDASELAQIYTAARMELDKQWSQDLADAVAVLEETMFGAAAEPSAPAPAGRMLGQLQSARADRRRVSIEYSRAWHHGVQQRVIDPLRLVQTRRGWEVDAGPLDDAGRLRTFLLRHIRAVEVLDETFEVPADLSDRLAEQRATDTVRVRLPFAARWAAEMYAERVTVVAEEESTVVLDLEMLPPLQQRVGLLLLVAGPEAELVSPTAHATARAELAARLIAHHGG